MENWFISFHEFFKFSGPYCEIFFTILIIKNKQKQQFTSNSICGWAGSFKFQIFTLWSNAIEINMSWANGCHLTNWTLSPWAEKIKWGSLTGSIKPPSGIFQIRIAPSSQEVATRELSKGSKSKSKTVVPLIKTGTTPSGILPGLLVSKMANLPPGPIKFEIWGHFNFGLMIII